MPYGRCLVVAAVYGKIQPVHLSGADCRLKILPPVRNCLRKLATGCGYVRISLSQLQFLRCGLDGVHYGNIGKAYLLCWCRGVPA
jgi:hypothetical protein